MAHPGLMARLREFWRRVKGGEKGTTYQPTKKKDWERRK